MIPSRYGRVVEKYVSVHKVMDLIPEVASEIFSRGRYQVSHANRLLITKPPIRFDNCITYSYRRNHLRYSDMCERTSPRSVFSWSIRNYHTPRLEIDQTRNIYWP